jgi:hypothetical protein
MAGLLPGLAIDGDAVLDAGNTVAAHTHDEMAAFLTGDGKGLGGYGTRGR